MFCSWYSQIAVYKSSFSMNMAYRL